MGHLYFDLTDAFQTAFAPTRGDPCGYPQLHQYPAHHPDQRSQAVVIRSYSGSHQNRLPCMRPVLRCAGCMEALWKNAGLECAETRVIRIATVYSDFDDFWDSQMPSRWGSSALTLTRLALAICWLICTQRDVIGRRHNSDCGQVSNVTVARFATDSRCAAGRAIRARSVMPVAARLPGDSAASISHVQKKALDRAMWPCKLWFIYKSTFDSA